MVGVLNLLLPLVTTDIVILVNMHINKGNKKSRKYARTVCARRKLHLVTTRDIVGHVIPPISKEGNQYVVHHIVQI
jgi:hypothetical protein